MEIWWTYKLKVKVEKIEEVKVDSIDFENFVAVQISGKYNMFSPQARMETGLSKDVYFAIMQNFDELEKCYGLQNPQNKSPR